jgi:hypothetical protein
MKAIELSKEVVNAFFQSKDRKDPDMFYNLVIKLSNELARNHDFYPDKGEEPIKEEE